MLISLLRQTIHHDILWPISRKRWQNTDPLYKAHRAEFEENPQMIDLVKSTEVDLHNSSSLPSGELWVTLPAVLGDMGESCAIMRAIFTIYAIGSDNCPMFSCEYHFFYPHFLAKIVHYLRWVWCVFDPTFFSKLFIYLLNSMIYISENN